MISLIIVIKVTSILDLEFGMAPWRPLAPLIDRKKKKVINLFYLIRIVSELTGATVAKRLDRHT